MTSISFAALPISGALLLAACSSSAPSYPDPTDSTSVVSSSSTASASSGGVDCHLDPPGAPFTFHITNTGPRMLRLPLGCGKTVPITVMTPSGEEGLGPGNADTCEVPCEVVYAGHPNPGCTQCGQGIGADLPPGGKYDLVWDRRSWVLSGADPACSGLATDNVCALGAAVDPATKMGTLAICNDPGGTPFECPKGKSEPFAFAFDLSTNGATIQVK